MVVNNEFRAFICEAKTGKILAYVPVVDPKWGMRLNDGGPLSATIMATSKEVRGLDLNSLTTSNRRFLGFAVGDFVIDAGPIQSRSYKAGSGRLEVTAASLWRVFDRRKVLPGAALSQGASPATKWTMRVPASGTTSLGSIAREIVRVSTQDNPYADAGALNVVLPPELAGGHFRTYQGYDLRWQGEALRQLTEVIDGPDIRFRPRFSGADPTVVEWVMETGTEAEPMLFQNGPDWVWDGSRPDSGVVGFDADEDGSEMASRAWAPGSGQERDMKLGKATDTTLIDLDWPWLETDSASKQEEDQTVLDGQAQQTVQEAAGPLVSFGIEVRADRDPLLGTYLPGDFARVVVPEGHPILAPGPVRVRIMAIDGDQSQKVKLTVAPFIGSMAGSAYGTRSVSETVYPVYPDSSLYPGEATFPGTLTPPN
jgi:hypothetical protein